jgi:hypothetical protein
MPLPTPHNVHLDPQYPDGFRFQIDIEGKTYDCRITGARARALPGGSRDPKRAVETSSEICREVLKLYRDDPNQPVLIA